MCAIIIANNGNLNFLALRPFPSFSYNLFPPSPELHDLRHLCSGARNKQRQETKKVGPQTPLKDGRPDADLESERHETMLYRVTHPNGKNLPLTYL